jgi:hypothetical protein
MKNTNPAHVESLCERRSGEMVKTQQLGGQVTT